MGTPTETHPIDESNGTSLDEAQLSPERRNRKTALYRVTHKQSGGDYVGISVKPTVRWRQHRHDAAAGSGFIFHVPWNKGKHKSVVDVD